MQRKKSKKKLTSVSFAFTHTYTLEKLTLLPFFPQAYMENFEKCAKRKRKKHFISLHCPMLSVVVFPPLFFNLSLYVILDIPEVPAFKKRAQVFGR